MVHSMFHLPLPALEKILRAALVYAFLVVALRLAGKREMLQLSTTDFVVLLAVANAVQNGIIGNDNSVTGGLLGGATLFVLNAALAVVLYRSHRARVLVEGTPTVLIDNGRIVVENLRNEKITHEELQVAIQRQGAREQCDVERCVLAPGGAIVITEWAPEPEERSLAALNAKLDQVLELLERR
jgi:uncharacterized membrane protein YcaP (DUF421 family)